jgi:hypothetical protein
MSTELMKTGTVSKVLFLSKGKNAVVFVTVGLRRCRSKHWQCLAGSGAHVGVKASDMLKSQCRGVRLSIGHA